MKLSRRRFLQSTALFTGALLTRRLPLEAASPSSPFKIAWTFDDGPLNQFTELHPLLTKVNAKATFYIVSDWLASKHQGSMSKEQVLELAANGHEIGGHTVSHLNLVDLYAKDPKGAENQI